MTTTEAINENARLEIQDAPAEPARDRPGGDDCADPKRQQSAAESIPAAPTVLFIEDAVASIHLIRGVLKRAKIRGGGAVRLISAMQGNLGLEMARVHAPDLILLDLHLPDMSGIQVLNQLKADARTSSIPVVVLTADPLPGTEAQVRDGGAVAFLSKPLDVAQFLKTVSHVFEETSQAIKKLR